MQVAVCYEMYVKAYAYALVKNPFYQFIKHGRNSSPMNRQIQDSFSRILDFTELHRHISQHKASSQAFIQCFDFNCGVWKFSISAF